MRDYALSFGIALGASIVLTFGVRALARKLGYVAKPRADRWHKKPTALYGGVGIFAAFIVSYLVHPPADAEGDILLLACSSGMFLLGLVDDRLELKPYAKLVGQIVFSTVFTMFGMRLQWLPSPVLDQGLTIFWLVGIANAVNLLDNLDGLAGGIAAISSAYLVYFCHSAGQPAAAELAAAFSGAVVGFLVFNFNPASIFMGDCGSMFLGFFLGGVTLVNNQVGVRRNIIAVLTIPVLLLLIPIIDTTLVTLTRTFYGRRVSQGGRDHSSHRLVALGLSERAAALTLWVLAAASGAVAVMVHNISWMLAALLVPVFGGALLLFFIFLGRVSVYEGVDENTAPHGRALLPTLADFTYKRRIFEVLHDLAAVVIAYYAAYLLRFDGARVEPYYSAFLQSLPLVIVAQLAAFLALGLYRGLWRYTSMSDLATLSRAVFGGWVAAVVALMFAFHAASFSRGMLAMDLILLLIILAGSRVSFRVIRTWIARFQQPADGTRRVLIYGAGDGGELLLRELMNNRDLGLHPVGFVDDDPQKLGRVIHGVRVLGSLDELGELAGSQSIEEVVISTTKLAAERSAQVALLCAQVGVACRRMRIALE
jgi:UDP-GlcNAc:undecaprenyl-phosphate/decaprenyl-phosphate GlcNAc-1-phosphate transferase